MNKFISIIVLLLNFLTVFNFKNCEINIYVQFYCTIGYIITYLLIIRKKSHNQWMVVFTVLGLILSTVYLMKNPIDNGVVVCANPNNVIKFINNSEVKK